MTQLASRLQARGSRFRCRPPPAGAYGSAGHHVALVVTFGQVPLRGGDLLAQGKVSAEVDGSTAANAAEPTALNAPAAAGSVVDLDHPSPPASRTPPAQPCTARR